MEAGCGPAGSGRTAELAGRLSFKLVASLVGCLGVIFALFGYQLTEQHRSADTRFDERYKLFL